MVINVVIVTCLVYFVYFFFFSDYYNIKNINVNGINYVSTDDFIELVDTHVDNFKFAFVDTENIFLYNKSKLLSMINEQYLFAEITIEKVLPDTINIDIVEKNVVYRFVSTSHEYLVDDHGILVKKITNYNNRPSLLTITQGEEEEDAKSDLVSLDENDPFTVLYFEEDIPLGIGQDIFTDNDVAFIDGSVKKSKNVLYDLKLISIPTVFPEHIRLSTVEGWDILFNLNDPFDKQFDALKEVIDQKVEKENVSRLEYIDLRLGKNIYFKYKY